MCDACIRTSPLPYHVSIHLRPQRAIGPIPPPHAVAQFQRRNPHQEKHVHKRQAARNHKEVEGSEIGEGDLDQWEGREGDGIWVRGKGVRG